MPATKIGFSKPLLPIGNPDVIAARLRRAPEGRRALFFVGLAIDRLPHAHPEDRLDGDAAPHSIFWEHGVSATSARLSRFAAALKGNEVAPDFIALDIERPLSTWVLGRCPDAGPQWRAIETDPRFALPTWLDEHATLSARACQPNDLAFRDRWNRDMHRRVTQYLNDAFTAPLTATFPRIGVSNYDHYDWPANTVVRDLNGHRFQRLASLDSTVGTHQSPQLYGRLNQLRGRVDPGETISRFETPFDSMRAALNRLRSAALGSSLPLAPWIAREDFGSDGAVPMANTPYWRELVLHTALSGVDRILYFNAATGPGDTAAARAQDDRRMEAVLGEFETARVCGQPVLATRDLLADDLSFVATGARLGHTGLWRITSRRPDDPFRVQRRNGRLVLSNRDVTLDFGPAESATASAETNSAGIWVHQANGYSPPASLSQ